MEAQNAWTRVVTPDNRCYYWNTQTNEVSWNPLHSLVRNEQVRMANDMIQDLCEIGQRTRLQTALHIGLACRLKRVFDAWRSRAARPSKVDVHTLASSIQFQLNCSQELKAILSLFKTEIDTIESELERVVSAERSMLQETVSAKITAAAHEYELLTRFVKRQN